MKIKTEGIISVNTRQAPKIKIGAKGESHEVSFDLYGIKLEDLLSLTEKRLSITIEDIPERLKPL